MEFENVKKIGIVGGGVMGGGIAQVWQSVAMKL